MKPGITITLILAFLCLVPMTVLAQVVNGRFSTSFYAWEKFDTVGVSHTLLRGMQSAQFDITQGNISIQTYLYGASSLTNSFGDQGIIRVNNMYLKWKNIGDLVDASIGRVPVFAGVGNGIVDGVALKSKMGNDKLTLALYGGENVHPDLRSSGLKDLNKNFLVGSQVIANVLQESRFSLSYLNRHIQREEYIAFRPDSIFIPISPGSEAEQIVGLDTRINESKLVSGYGRFDYDLNFNRTLRGQISTRWRVTDNLALTGDYLYRNPHILYNSFFAIFPTSSISEYEGGVEYRVSPSIHTYGKFGYVQYTDDLSRKISVGVSSEYGSITYAGSNGYAGELTSLDAQVMYPLFERKFIPTVGFSYGQFKMDNYGSAKENVYATVFGAVVRPATSWSTDVQVQWLTNPIAQNDVRFLGKICYWFRHDLKFFQNKETAQ